MRMSATYHQCQCALVATKIDFGDFLNCRYQLKRGSSKLKAKSQGLLFFHIPKYARRTCSLFASVELGPSSVIRPTSITYP